MPLASPGTPPSPSLSYLGLVALLPCLIGVVAAGAGSLLPSIRPSRRTKTGPHMPPSCALIRLLDPFSSQPPPPPRSPLPLPSPSSAPLGVIISSRTATGFVVHSSSTVVARAIASVDHLLSNAPADGRAQPPCHLSSSSPSSLTPLPATPISAGKGGLESVVFCSHRCAPSSKRLTLAIKRCSYDL